MFDNLSERLTASLRGITGKARLTEENIQGTLREVRMALLEADVALAVVRDFVDRVRERAVGTEITSNLNAGQSFVKIVNDELVRMMGGANDGLALNVAPPAVVLMAGLQGAGKTTAVAKLAKLLMERDKKKVMAVSADVYRPAAIEQLQTLVSEVGAEFVPSTVMETPLAIVRRAKEQAKLQLADVLLVDTAGRLAIDDAMMTELQELHAELNPVETLFVVDAMTGQDAANTAKAFNEALPLTGVILSKVDGDARGGAALSVRAITGKPIKFLGVGEKVDALEPFHPDRIASRILGMGDMMTLIEEAERKLDRKQADKLARKLSKGKKFDFNDMRVQLQQMNDMGGMSAMMEKLPGMGALGQMPQAAEGMMDDKATKKMDAIISSMTEQERRFPDLISGSRKRRIAAGSGTQIPDVNRLLKQHKTMQKMMRKMTKKGGLAKMMRGLGGMKAPPPGARLR